LNRYSPTQERETEERVQEKVDYSTAHANFDRFNTTLTQLEYGEKDEEISNAGATASGSSQPALFLPLIPNHLRKTG
jgi:hypothetical protein